MVERLRGQVARDLFTDSRLSEPEYVVLVQLSEAEGRRVRMTDLAARLNWSKSRLSHQLARMQARGLVSREECPSDARGAFAVLGSCGLAELERAAPLHVESVRRHLIDVLEPVQLTQLADIAERVIQHLSGESACSAAREAASEGSCGDGLGVDGLGVGALAAPAISGVDSPAGQGQAAVAGRIEGMGGD
jgi:DNA-binding MarR family transcriptional regulator